MSRYLLIKGGTVIDGTRNASPKKRDVLIRGERVERVATRIRVVGARTIDARGLVVTPGFIDAHAHSDVNAFLDPTAQSRVFQGVTTEINGMCGSSLFPLTGPEVRGRRRSLRRLTVEPRWKDAAGFFDALEARGSAINRAFFVGHGALRVSVTGYEARPAHPSEIRRMAWLLDEALEQGAIGMSTGLCYAPGCFAAPSELRELCRRLARVGRPHVTHIRSEGRGLMAAVREVIGYSQSSGAPLHISHVKTTGHANWWKIGRLKSAFLEARKKGIALTADRYPYVASQTGLSIIFPEWLMAGGKTEALRRLKHKATRRRLKRQLLSDRANKTPWDRIRIASIGKHAKEFEGMTVDAVAEEMGLDPCEAACELLVISELAVSVIFFSMSERNLETILKWPFVFIGSDSAARAVTGPTAEGKPHPRGFGTFGRFLSEYVLRRRLMCLPEAIAKITSRPAERFGFKDRGVLRVAAYADICVFDPKTIRDKATYETPMQLSEGIRHLIVNGRPVIENGRQKRALPGSILRSRELSNRSPERKH